MFSNKLLKVSLMCSVSLLIGCGIEATLVSPSSATLAVKKVDNSGVVNDANQNSFLMQGICQDISEVVISTDSFSVNTPCIDNVWSINLDLSALSGQVITVKIVGVSKDGLKESSTSIQLTKKLSCLLGGQTIPDGQSILAYTSATVVSGDTCSSVAESRLCTNGTLSGSAMFLSCSQGLDAAALVSVEEYEERVSESVGVKSFTLRLSEAKPYSVNVRYYVSGDYVYMLDADLNPSGTVTFAANETTKTISFQVFNNAIAQPERLMQLNLIGTDSPMVSLGEHYQARLFLKDNDGGFEPNIQKVFVIGSEITCVLTADGSLSCAGAQFGPAPVEVDAGVKYQKIAAGRNNSFCGLTNLSKIRCNDGSNQLMIAEDSTVSYLDLDSTASPCGVTVSNELRCKVDNAFQVLDAGVPYKKVSVESYKICGLTAGNTIRCASTDGDSVDGFYSIDSFEDVDAGVQYSDISNTGENDIYGLTSLGEWKRLCAYEDCTTPTVLLAGSTFVSLHRKCAINDGGVAKCMNSASLNLTHLFKQIHTASSGGNYQRGCGVTTTDELLCWSHINNNHIAWRGPDALASNSVRTEMQGLTNVAKVRTFVDGLDSVTCAIQSNGQVKCFNGEVESFFRSTPVDKVSLASHNIKDFINDYYLLNSDGYVLKLTASMSYEQADTEKYTSLVTGGMYVNYCGITENQKLRCLKGAVFEEPFPGATIKDYAGDYSQGCYLSVTGVLTCWDNYQNTLPTATVIDNTDTYTQISGSYLKGCGVSATSHEVKCWDNYDNIPMSPVVFTIQDPGIQYVKVFALHGVHDNKVCGITTTGVLRCGTRNGAYSVIDSGSSYSEVTSVDCGITTDGKYRCSGGFAAGSVYVSWKRPILMNKWFTRATP
ncbi:hypothetical protein AZI87_11575 [Bdellovibrio bacteriovorus]|uniref:Lipoprotein n=1 Tax=Bdellovibrio bacteriovorus TaxID=959 RepID=A0A161PRW2_BDEBC|nr:hypothetical protein [Bdellovibrio bacteriovorus]KYG65198.1 hypothetical protein AZI87_11575 [Bdellovibrio bacteriovorus]